MDGRGANLILCTRRITISAIRYATEAMKYKPGDAEATKIVNDSHAALTPAKKDPAVAIPPKTDPNQADYEKYIGGARTSFAQKNYDLAIRYATEAMKYKPADAEATKIVNDSHAALTPVKKDPVVAVPPKPIRTRRITTSTSAGAKTSLPRRTTNWQFVITRRGDEVQACRSRGGDQRSSTESHAALTPAKKDPVVTAPPKTDPNQAEYDKWIGGARTSFAQRNFDQAIQYATEALKHKPADRGGDQDRQRFPRRLDAAEEGSSRHRSAEDRSAQA